MLLGSVPELTIEYRLRLRRRLAGPGERAAQALLVQSMKAPTVPKCPAYTVDGLVYSKGGKQVRPVFLAKRDLDAALKKAEASGVAPASKSVVVLDLLELVNELAIGLKGGVELATCMVGHPDRINTYPLQTFRIFAAQNALDYKWTIPSIAQPLNVVPVG